MMQDIDQQISTNVLYKGNYDDLEKDIQYYEDKVLGKGSFGKVYEGIIKQSMTKIAVKYMSSNEQDKIEAFKTELRAFGQVIRVHQNVVGCISYYFDTYVQYKKTYFNTWIILPLCQSDLQKEINAGKQFFYADVVMILQQCLKGLLHLKQHGMFHRDIKPANILKISDGQYALSDFGVSKIVAKAQDAKLNEQLTQLQGYTLVGTENFLAPEMFFQYHSDENDSNQTAFVYEKCDIFSLGLVAMQIYFNMNSTKGLNNGKSGQKLIIQNLKQIQETDLRQILYCMLRKNIKKRFSIQQALNYLDARQNNQEIQIQMSEDEDEDDEVEPILQENVFQKLEYDQPENNIQEQKLLQQDINNRGSKTYSNDVQDRKLKKRESEEQIQNLESTSTSQKKTSKTDQQLAARNKKNQQEVQILTRNLDVPTDKSQQQHYQLQQIQDQNNQLKNQLQHNSNKDNTKKSEKKLENQEKCCCIFFC